MLPRCRGIATCCATHSGGPFNVAISGNCNGEAFGNPAENDRLIRDDSNLMKELETSSGPLLGAEGMDRRFYLIG
jgi:hypothetical protein